MEYLPRKDSSMTTGLEVAKGNAWADAGVTGNNGAGAEGTVGKSWAGGWDPAEDLELRMRSNIGLCLYFLSPLTREWGGPPDLHTFLCRFLGKCRFLGYIP
jgi:hypothetical protein